MSLTVKSLLRPISTLATQLFGIDRRTLAATRLALATILVLDLIQRSRSLYAFMDDRGTLPRSLLLSDFANQTNFSIHMISGAWPIQAILFIIAGIFAILMLVGYKTRLATIASWLLLLSLHNRNPFIPQAGDVLLRMGLFWGMFLPWGRAFSVDAAIRPWGWTSQKKVVASVATAAILLQVALVYFGGGIHKSREVWFNQGNALYLTLNLDEFTTSLGTWLLGWPWLLTFLSRSTYLLELYGPFLLFFPFSTQYIRLLLVVAYASFHLGIATTLKIGLFAWTDLAILLVFLPPLFWDVVASLLRRLSPTPIHIYYDSDCGLCRKIVGTIQTFLLPYNSTASPAGENPAIAKLMAEKNSWVVIDNQKRPHFAYDGVYIVAAASPFTRWLTPLLRERLITKLGERLYAWVANHRRLTCLPETPQKELLTPRQKKLRTAATQIVAGAFLILVVGWNAAAYPGVTWKFPPAFYGIVSLARIDQHWGMFAPAPPQVDGWYVVPALLRNGTQVDIFSNNNPVSWDKPASVSSTYIDQFWRKYLMLIANSNYLKARPYYAQYLCQRWNSTHPPEEQATQLWIYYVLERTPPTRHDPAIPLEHHLHLEYTCPTS